METEALMLSPCMERGNIFLIVFGSSLVHTVCAQILTACRILQLLTVLFLGALNLFERSGIELVFISEGRPQTKKSKGAV